MIAVVKPNLRMVTEADSADSPRWDQPALPIFWTNDLPVARATLARIAIEAGIILPVLNKAVEQVIDAHRNQYRKGTDAPYVVHPIRLACTLIDSFGVRDVELVCAALLHDVLEDTQLTRAMLERGYGARVADLVAILSRRDGEQRPPEGDRPESAYLQRIRAHGDAAILIKLADKIDNLRDAVSHPDRSRVDVFVNETFIAYVLLARSLTDSRLAKRAERLLLEAAGRTGGIQTPRFLRALLATVSRCLDNRDFSEVPFPSVAVALYCFLNPEARAWLEFDGIAIAHESLPARNLAVRIASSLRQYLGGLELPFLLELAGIPLAFAARSNESLWRRAAAHLAHLQTLLAADDVPPWLATLLQPGNERPLLALVQSSIYLPASWRSPMWSADLGAVLSQRMREISGAPSAALPSFALSHRLALSRDADGTGTRRRARRVFEHEAVRCFAAPALWALRLGMEALQSSSGNDDLWQQVHDKTFAETSLPAHPGVIPDGLTETIDYRETQRLFAGAGASKQFAELVRALTREQSDSTRWIVFDHEEWYKRQPRWSQPDQLRIDGSAALDELEVGGARVIRQCFSGTKTLTVLPARRFALQDRLPEITAAQLTAIVRNGYTAVAIFDAMIVGATAPLWVPRVYRILDTIEDLDPEFVQALTVEYESANEPVPRLHAFLPLPATDEEAAAQEERKQFLVRYLSAQIYGCGVVRQIRRARISCAAVAESRRRHAFSDRELRDALTLAANELGLHAAFGSYIERYGYERFGVTAGSSDYLQSAFGPDEMRKGIHVGIDIGGQRVKIAVIRWGHLIENPNRREIRTPQNVTVEEFCRDILGHVDRELANVSVRWEEVNGLGISWPGAVRGNRIVGMSRSLEGLRDGEQRFSPSDPIDRLGSFDLLDTFRAVVRQVANSVKEDLAFSLLNDGDAEAFGNHALRSLKGVGKPGGKIFVKLGTSLAGGRVTAAGAVAEDIAEFSKIVLQLPDADSNGPWRHLARSFISAEAVRNLSRAFVFGGTVLFGEREGTNSDSNMANRIEPIELGQLLPLFSDSDASMPFLADLVQTDNQGSAERIEKAIATTGAALQKDKHDSLIEYVRQRGMDFGRPSAGWSAGLDRTLWLCTGERLKRADSESILPERFPFDRLARTIVGTVALFSQIGLYIAHLIAQLYNIYRRGAFSEVVLAGGVLSGRTGEVVETQTKGFLARYYDKIYGGGKPLAPDTLVRAGLDNVSNPGVFGAAMAANRQWQVERDRLLDRRISERLRLLPTGEEIAVDELLAISDDSSLRGRALSLLERHLATGEIVRTPSGRIQKIS